MITGSEELWEQLPQATAQKHERSGANSRLVHPTRLELALLDPQVARELGFEGIVAKNHSSLYRPNDRRWVKIKNPNYWRRDSEREAMSRKHERRARTRV